MGDPLSKGTLRKFSRKGKICNSTGVARRIQLSAAKEPPAPRRRCDRQTTGMGRTKGELKIGQKRIKPEPRGVFGLSARASPSITRSNHPTNESHLCFPRDLWTARGDHRRVTSRNVAAAPFEREPAPRFGDREIPVKRRSEDLAGKFWPDRGVCKFLLRRRAAFAERKSGEY